MPVVVGTSGWHYPHWRSSFYPTSLPAAQWLDYYARRFATVEVNASFYRLPSVTTVQAWRRAVPEDFVMAAKASRYLTHVRRLRDPSEPVTRMMERLRELGSALGPVLLQLPPDFRADVAALDATLAALAALAPTTKVAVEFRHPSWFETPTRQALERWDAATCLADAQGPQGPAWRTASWGYLRFHQGRGRPAPAYGHDELQRWAETIAGLWPDDAPVFAYFNNDAGGCAPRDARRLALAVEGLGRSVTRTDAPADEG